MYHEIEAAFAHLGWTCRTEQLNGTTSTHTLIHATGGRRVVEVNDAGRHRRIQVRVGTGVICPAERRGEMALFLAHLNFVFDAATFGLAPSGMVVARVRVLNVRPGPHVRRLVATAIVDANKSIDAFRRALEELVSGRMNVAEVLEALREPRSS